MTGRRDTRENMTKRKSMFFLVFSLFLLFLFHKGPSHAADLTSGTTQLQMNTPLSLPFTSSVDIYLLCIHAAVVKRGYKGP
jgi:hypothetical protein